MNVIHSVVKPSTVTDSLPVEAGQVGEVRTWSNGQGAIDADYVVQQITCHAAVDTQQYDVTMDNHPTSHGSAAVKPAWLTCSPDHSINGCP